MIKAVDYDYMDYDYDYDKIVIILLLAMISITNSCQDQVFFSDFGLGCLVWREL